MPSTNKLEANLSWPGMLPRPHTPLLPQVEGRAGRGRGLHGILSACALAENEAKALSLREYHGSELAQFVDVLHGALKVRSRHEFLLWSQGRLQRFLPHDIMIVARGNFALPALFDIVAAVPSMHPEPAHNINLAPMLKWLFDYWNLHARTPFQLGVEEGLFPGGALDGDFRGMKSVLVHAITDAHEKHDCLCVLMSASAYVPASGRSMLEILLPYIDRSLRQIEKRPGNGYASAVQSVSAEFDASALSSREMQIMEWVRHGKTNFEIGMILDISSFTVKNHLQRIFRKLNVVNRAQAVAKLGKALQLDDSL